MEKTETEKRSELMDKIAKSLDESISANNKQFSGFIVAFSTFVLGSLSSNFDKLEIGLFRIQLAWFFLLLLVVIAIFSFLKEQKLHCDIKKYIIDENNSQLEKFTPKKINSINSQFIWHYRIMSLLLIFMFFSAVPFLTVFKGNTMSKSSKYVKTNNSISAQLTRDLCKLKKLNNNTQPKQDDSVKEKNKIKEGLKPMINMEKINVNKK